MNDSQKKSRKARYSVIKKDEKIIYCEIDNNKNSRSSSTSSSKIREAPLGHGIIHWFKTDDDNDEKGDNRDGDDEDEDDETMMMMVVVVVVVVVVIMMMMMINKRASGILMADRPRVGRYHINTI